MEARIIGSAAVRARCGVGVCDTESALLRVFCHAAGDRVILSPAAPSR